MKKIICVLLMFVTFSSLGQYTSIPDPNFEQALIDLGHDNVIDGQVLTNNISSIVNLDVSLKNINSLEGIEDFQQLSNLKCFSNNLVALNLNSNDNLTWLDCFNNNITSLSIDSCQSLMHLDCSFNDLISLNVNYNEALQELYCSQNQLVEINLGPLINSPNIPDLSDLNLDYNNLTFLDITDFPNLETFSCKENNLTCLKVNVWLGWGQWNSFETTSNPNLFCIQTDNLNWSQMNWTDIDPWTQFNTNCDLYCNPVSGVSEGVLQYEKNLIKVVNLMGQEVIPTPNALYIKVFSDGTVEKVITID